MAQYLRRSREDPGTFGPNWWGAGAFGKKYHNISTQSDWLFSDDRMGQAGFLAFNILILSISKKGHLAVYFGFTVDIKTCCKVIVNLPMGQTLVKIGKFPRWWILDGFTHPFTQHNICLQVSFRRCSQFFSKKKHAKHASINHSAIVISDCPGK